MPAFGEEKKKQTLGVDDFLTSSPFAFDRKKLRILVYGQPKVGKTTAAIGVSSKWPGKLPSPSPVLLDDVLSIAADSNANEGLRAVGVSPLELDVREWLRTGKVKNIVDALKKIPDIAHDLVESRGVQYVVIDTISMIDVDLGKHWFSPAYAPRSEKTGEIDKFACFREILNSHSSFWHDMDYVPATLIFLCHSKVSSEGTAIKPTQKEKAKLAASTLAGTDVEIVPQLTGQGGDLYLKQVGMILPMRMFGDAGSDRCERKFLPYGGNGMTGGNRYQHLMKEEEPADLGALIRRCEENAKKYTK